MASVLELVRTDSIVTAQWRLCSKYHTEPLVGKQCVGSVASCGL